MTSSKLGLGRVSCIKWILYCHVSVCLICNFPFIRLANDGDIDQSIAKFGEFPNAFFLKMNFN